jgi:hypothetical protein
MSAMAPPPRLRAMCLLLAQTHVSSNKTRCPVHCTRGMVPGIAITAHCSLNQGGWVTSDGRRGEGGGADGSLRTGAYT